MMYANMPARITVRRRTGYVLDPVEAAASLATYRQPTRAALLQAKVSGGTSNTGTLTISGTVNGSANTEVFTWTGAGPKQSAKKFSAISGMTTTGLADEGTKPTIEVKAIDPSGNPIEQERAIVTGWPAGMDHGSPAWETRQDGASEVEWVTWFVAYDETWTPRRDDEIEDEATGEVYVVEGIGREAQGFYPSHWEVRARRRQR